MMIDHILDATKIILFCGLVSLPVFSLFKHDLKFPAMLYRPNKYPILTECYTFLFLPTVFIFSFLVVSELMLEASTQSEMPLASLLHNASAFQIFNAFGAGFLVAIFAIAFAIGFYLEFKDIYELKQLNPARSASTIRRSLKQVRRVDFQHKGFEKVT